MTNVELHAKMVNMLDRKNQPLQQGSWYSITVKFGGHIMTPEPVMFETSISSGILNFVKRNGVGWIVYEENIVTIEKVERKGE